MTDVLQEARSTQRGITRDICDFTPGFYYRQEPSAYQYTIIIKELRLLNCPWALLLCWSLPHEAGVCMYVCLDVPQQPPSPPQSVPMTYHCKQPHSISPCLLVTTLSLPPLDGQKLKQVSLRSGSICGETDKIISVVSQYQSDILYRCGMLFKFLLIY